MIKPQDGFWANGCFEFLFHVPVEYPFAPPSVRCVTPVFHPNIDSNTGDIALALLYHNWKPVLSINTVVFALQLLFVEPDLDSIKNLECATLYRGDQQQFVQRVMELSVANLTFHASKRLAVEAASIESARYESKQRVNPPEIPEPFAGVGRKLLRSDEPDDRTAKRHRSDGPVIPIPLMHSASGSGSGSGLQRTILVAAGFTPEYGRWPSNPELQSERSQNQSHPLESVDMLF
jgi:ubiquitin-protein ligase